MLRRRIPKMSVLQSIRGEAIWQWKKDPRRFGIILFLLGIAALYAGVTSWKETWDRIDQHTKSEIEFSLGLLDMRLTEHLQQAEALAQDRDVRSIRPEQNKDLAQSRLQRSLSTDDQQTALILTRDGVILAQEPKPVLSKALIDCLQDRITRMPSLANRSTAGLVCTGGEQRVIGAVSRINQEASSQGLADYVVHLSPLQRRSAPPALQSWFQKLAGNLEIHTGPTANRGLHLNDLLPPDQHLDLKQEHQTGFNVTTATLGILILPWLLVASLSIYLLSTFALSHRRRRLRQAIKKLKVLRQQRIDRKELKLMLANPRQLQHYLDAQSEESSQNIIACVEFIDEFPSASTQTADDAIAYQLVRAFKETIQTDAIGRLNAHQLLLILGQNDTFSGIEALQSAISSVCTAVIAETRAKRPLLIRALLSRVEQERGSMQIRDLLYQLSSLPRESTIQIWQPHQQPLRRESSSLLDEDDDHRWLKAISTQSVEQQQALLFQSGQFNPLYTRISFNPLSNLIDTTSLDSVVPLNLLTQSKQTPPMDRCMLQRALETINSHGDESRPFLIRISSRNLSDSNHFQRLLQLLQAHSADALTQLILELDAVSLLSGTGYCREQVKQLQELGLAIAIDDSAINAPPIKAIFTLKPNYLMVGPGLADRTQDPNADTVVDFLVGYCRYKHCTLVMTEVNDAATLSYWNNRGVTAFEGNQAEQLAA